MGSTGSVDAKFKVHVAFAEADLYFVNKLLAALQETGEFELSVTPPETMLEADWARDTGDLIAAADAVVFILSPAAAESATVTRGAEMAGAMSKRMLTVLSQPIRKRSSPLPLESIRPVRMETQGAYRANLSLLLRSLKQDHAWIRQHTALYAKALHWQAAGHDPAALLAGPDVIAAKAWTFERPDHAPKPTDLHIDFIRQSEDAPLAAPAGPPETEAESSGGEVEATPGLARRAAARFASLLRPGTSDTQAPDEAAPAAAEPLETQTTSEPVSEPEPAARPVPAPVPEEPRETAPPQVLETRAEPEPAMQPEPAAIPDPQPLTAEAHAAAPPEVLQAEAGPEPAMQPEPAPEPAAEPAPVPDPEQPMTAKAPVAAAADPEPELKPALDEWLSALPAALPAVVARARPAGSLPASDIDLDRVSDGLDALKVTRMPARRTRPYRAPARAAATAATDDAGSKQRNGRPPPAPGTTPLAPRLAPRPPVPATDRKETRPAPDQAVSVPARRAPVLVPDAGAPAQGSCATTSWAAPQPGPAAAGVKSVSVAAAPKPAAKPAETAETADAQPDDADDAQLARVLKSFLTEEEDILDFR